MTERDDPQSRVTAFFETHSGAWDDLYATVGLRPEIFRTRQARVLTWIDGLRLALGARVLDVGSGAGHLTVALAERGFRVVAIDPSESMRARTRLRIEQSERPGGVDVLDADVQALPFPDEHFDLVVALGVLPWVPSPRIATEEMSRVLKPGGHVVVTADNAWRLMYVFDPRLLPALAWLRRGLRRLLPDRRRQWLRNGVEPHAVPTSHSIRFVNRLLAPTLITVRAATIGFGPFTFFGRPALADDRGIALHRRLQLLADRRSPLLRFAGTHYVVLARKRDAVD